MKRLLCSLLLLAPALNTFAQDKIELISWNVPPCDREADTDQMLRRISEFRFVGKELHLSLAFYANCCMKFKPQVRYSNDTLYILPWPAGKIDSSLTDKCRCDCFHTMNLVIGGLTDTSFETEFWGGEIKYNKEAYKTYPLRYAIENGDTINRINKYGEKIGYWHEIYKSGSQSMHMFTNDPLSPNTDLIWYKNYSSSGRLSEYYRNDTTEKWNDAGVLIEREIEVMDGKDRLSVTKKYFDNGKLHEQYVERHFAEPHHYPDGLVYYSTYDSREIYYENGQLLYLKGDTSKTWDENGKLIGLDYGEFEMEYYPDGKIKTAKRTWYSDIGGVKNANQQTLTKEYYQNGQLFFLKLERLEEDEEGKVNVYGSTYEWKWDEKGVLIKQPKNWTGPLPE